MPHTPLLKEAACPQAECCQLKLQCTQLPVHVNLGLTKAHPAKHQWVATFHLAENTSTMCLAPHMVSRRGIPCKKRSQSRQKTRKPGRISAKVTASRRCRYAPYHHIHEIYRSPMALDSRCQASKACNPSHATSHHHEVTPRAPRFDQTSQRSLTWHLTQSMPAGKSSVGTQRLLEARR